MRCLVILGESICYPSSEGNMSPFPPSSYLKSSAETMANFFKVYIGEMEVNKGAWSLTQGE